MSLGTDFRELVRDLLVSTGGFGSLLRWRHIARVEDPTTGAVAETPTEASFRGAVVDPIVLRLFGDGTLQQAATAIVVPAGQLAIAPKVLDQAQVSPPNWLRVIEVRELLGPGDAGSPVLIAYAAALGS